MGDKTGIEWTDATWNPVVGCQHTSAGCDNCYAAREAAGRLAHLPQYAGLAIREPGKPAEFTGVLRCLPERLSQPISWKRPRRIFVNSMSDLFHHDVPDEFIAQVFAVMAATPQHTYQVLTKRPQRMAAWCGAVELTSAGWALHDPDDPDDAVTLPESTPWPLPNVWLGVSIESDRYSFRADRLRETPAAVRFISAEPLLGPLPSLNLQGIDWLIVGGESGPAARPMHPDWVRQLRDRTAAPEWLIACDECGDDAELVAPCALPGSPDRWEYSCFNGHTSTRPGPAFLFKQWGEWAPLAGDGVEFGRWVDPVDGGTYATEADGRALMSRFGKKTAGRELDGRTWDEFPTVVAR